MIPPGVKLFVKHEILNKYLFILREKDSRIPSPDCWDLIGGEIEDESLEDAIYREKNEEVKGLEIYALEKITVYEGQKVSNNGDIIGTMKVHVFKALTRSDPLYTKIKSEGQKVHYFTLDEILNIKNTIPKLHDFIKEYRLKL